MDTPKSSQQSSLDSLRTVEFRQTLRGYHIDDVDEYLERVAVEAEALQEQLRQSNERTKQAAERIAQLEKLLADAREQREQPAYADQESRSDVSDDTLQRTLLLAQKFVDQTKAESEAQAHATLAKAEEQARSLMVEAEARARSVSEETERQMREEVGRLESLRTQLAEDVETIARHLDGERNRLRTALAEMLAWVDKQIQPAAAVLAKPEQRPGGVQASSSADPANGPTSSASMRDMPRTAAVQPAAGGR